MSLCEDRFLYHGHQPYHHHYRAKPYKTLLLFLEATCKFLRNFITDCDQYHKQKNHEIIRIPRAASFVACKFDEYGTLRISCKSRPFMSE